VAKRDQRARLIDNIGRQIRRLNAREKEGNLNRMQQRGLERQRQNLIQFREQVKQIDKSDKKALGRAEFDYKHNGNYSSSQKEIDQNTKRLVGSGVLPPEELNTEPTPPPSAGGTSGEGTGSGEGASGSGAPGAPSGGGAGESGEIEESGGEGAGTMTVMDQMADLFADLAQIEGKYIGAYMDAETRDQVNKIEDKISELKDQYGDDMTEDQMAQLDQLYDRLESASMNAHGNASIRDDSGRVIGYTNTFSMGEFKDHSSGIGGISFDVNKWINENMNLFVQHQSHPGRLSAEEKFEIDMSGFTGDYDY